VWHPGPSVQSTLIHQKDMQHLWRPSRYHKVQTITNTIDIVRLHNRVNFIIRAQRFRALSCQPATSLTKIVIRTIPHRFVWHPGPSVQSTLIHQKDMQHLWRPSRYHKVQTITITSDIVRIHNRVNFIIRAQRFRALSCQPATSLTSHLVLTQVGIKIPQSR